LVLRLLELVRLLNLLRLLRLRGSRLRRVLLGVWPLLRLLWRPWRSRRLVLLRLRVLLGRLLGLRRALSPERTALLGRIGGPVWGAAFWPPPRLLVLLLARPIEPRRLRLLRMLRRVVLQPRRTVLR